MSCPAIGTLDVPRPPSRLHSTRKRAPAARKVQSVSVAKTSRESDEFDDSALLAFFAVIATRDHTGFKRMLEETSGFAARPIRIGASRQVPRPYFFGSIHHYVYPGDTALHVAAAAHHRGIAEALVAGGADVRARNRKGAEPLHYAADGRPGADDWDPAGQRKLISYLIKIGADPDALDKSGAGPLHRAVRTRSSEAVSALIDLGADPLQMNKRGSTPLHLAVQNTGKSGSGSEVAREEQRRIIEVLLDRGASQTDTDAKGKSVLAAASSDWIRRLLVDR